MKKDVQYRDQSHEFGQHPGKYLQDDEDIFSNNHGGLDRILTAFGLMTLERMKEYPNPE